MELKPNLLNVCSQLRQESQAVYYQGTKFGFSWWERHKLWHLHRWLEVIGDDGRANIRHIRIDLSDTSPEDCIQEIERTNARLSEKAKVIYRQRNRHWPGTPEGESPLWKIGEGFKRLHPEASILLKVFIDCENEYKYSLPWGSEYPCHLDMLFTDLIFLPDNVGLANRLENSHSPRQKNKRFGTGAIGRVQDN